MRVKVVVLDARGLLELGRRGDVRRVGHEAAALAVLRDDVPPDRAALEELEAVVLRVIERVRKLDIDTDN
jgi:hypothetical protein